MKKLVLVALNELNFDVVRRYTQFLELPNFGKLLARHNITTRSESHYEQLEPWIQWVSVHSGMTADQHGIFRLGDIVGSDVPQIFEQLEKQGISVGSVCAMNAENRLADPAYFVPDPWTRTPSDGSWWSRALGEAVSQAVNDNAHGRISGKSLLHLVLGLMRFANPRRYLTYLRLALRSRGAPWRKALFLDLFLHDLHRSLHGSRQPQFSTVFFNAGAHIQHHYFFNARGNPGANLANPAWYVDSNADPMGEMLEVYDLILGDYLSRGDADLIVATGLTQRPYDRIKHYYRLRDHADFLRQVGIGFLDIAPRMTRDFLVGFADAQAADDARVVLAAITVGEKCLPLFGEIEVRGRELFVTLTYPEEIGPSTMAAVSGRAFALAPHVAFVAIKNGMHDATGYAFFSGRVAANAPVDGCHVASLHGTIRDFFLAPDAPASIP